MSIIKNLELKINNDEAKLSENIYVYQNDRGVELKLKLNSIRSSYYPTSRSLLFEDTELFAGATILKPNGELIPRKKVRVVDDVVSFVIDKDFTDQVDEIGVYKIQFHLFDLNDNRITIPPVSFEVKELIGIVDEEDMNQNI